MNSLDPEFNWKLDKIGIDFDAQHELEDIMNDALVLVESCDDNTTVDELDVVIRALFYYNRVHILEQLNLPFVSYDTIDGKIVHGSINRYKAKSARKIIK